MTMTIEQKKKSIKQCDIHFLKGEQFKTNIISVVLRIPLTKQNATKTALLAEVRSEEHTSELQSRP